MKRREFIATGLKAGISLALSTSALASIGRERDRLTILYTNDWHSRIEPFPGEGGTYSGLGGASKRAHLIDRIRSEAEHVLLLDAGDIFQGTPYFNLFHGELEFKLMTQMGYDAVTLGNHDFDAGIEGLKAQLPHAGFEILNANYRFGDRELRERVKPYRIFQKGPFRVGVFGLGIELKNLVPEALYGDTIYTNPVEAANSTATYLRTKKKCNLIVCLSHLGFEYKNDKVSDIQLAKASSNIDLILGGHTHTFLENPQIVNNIYTRPVSICQTGWAGINLGRIDYQIHSKTVAANPHSTMLKIC
ncbi:MAG: metallophosphatase [Flavobacteriales bacterium]|nr:metallophosphatase [Flavobacteriales bacterium]